MPLPGLLLPLVLDHLKSIITALLHHLLGLFLHSRLFPPSLHLHCASISRCRPSSHLGVRHIACLHLHIGWPEAASGRASSGRAAPGQRLHLARGCIWPGCTWPGCTFIFMICTLFASSMHISVFPVSGAGLKKIYFLAGNTVLES